MRKTLLCSAAVLFALCAPVISVAQSGNPDLRELKLVAQLPAEVPQRIMGLAYDGKKIWASIYHGRGRYVTLDPATLNWETNTEIQHYKVISTVAGAFESPGGVCFAKDQIWITGSYGESFGSIDPKTWKVTRLFKGKQREDMASQSYSSVAFDGNYLWIAWHWFRYDLPVSETQLLLKVDPESGKVVAQYPVAGGTRNDATHGLTWDGTKLWHIKDNKLSSVDPSTGEMTAQYMLSHLKRPSALAWANNALWIAEFDGKVWRLPFR
jgi:hypothetical protein